MRPKQVDQTLAMRRRSFLKSGLTAEVCRVSECR
ncbi:MAG: hypothetical protein Ct9H300mP1_29910 [Planctomycetaceae bacterium]|nr:MAG: hypothetical protein Ct9H300mP1_29910 [Planctomycetaceae bacterium]